MLIGIKSYHFISSDEVWCQTNRSLLNRNYPDTTSTLSLFGHVDDNIDASSSSMGCNRGNRECPGWRRCRMTLTSWTEAVDLTPEQSTDYSCHCQSTVVVLVHDGFRCQHPLLPWMCPLLLLVCLPTVVPRRAELIKTAVSQRSLLSGFMCFHHACYLDSII